MEPNTGSVEQSVNSHDISIHTISRACRLYRKVYMTFQEACPRILLCFLACQSSWAILISTTSRPNQNCDLQIWSKLLPLCLVKIATSRPGKNCYLPLGLVKIATSGPGQNCNLPLCLIKIATSRRGKNGYLPLGLVKIAASGPGQNSYLFLGLVKFVIFPLGLVKTAASVPGRIFFLPYFWA